MSGMTYDNRVLLALMRSIPDNLDRWIEQDVALGISGDITDLLSGPSPSRPGDPPGEDTGTLRATISLRRMRRFSYMIYSPEKYAPPLEFGSEHIAKRPFMVPIFENWRQHKLMDAARSAKLVE